MFAADMGAKRVHQVAQDTYLLQHLYSGGCKIYSVRFAAKEQYLQGRKLLVSGAMIIVIYLSRYLPRRVLR
jgi:hypothetical protein